VTAADGKGLAMTKQEFLEQLERAPMALPGLPVSSAMIRRLSEELRAGDPSWWKETAAAWQGRRFVAWTEAWSLFLAAVHFEVLSDAKSPLIPYFPSCGGTDEAEPGLALSRFLSAAPASFYDRLRTGERRSFVQARARLWLGPAMLYFQTRRLPYYLVEVNAGAGLNLAADLFAPPKGFASNRVLARVGLDAEPLLVEDIAHRRWLTAALLPDQMPLIRALDQAIDKLRQRQSGDDSFIQMVECAPALAPRFAAKNIPAEDEAGILLFNMAVTSRMDDVQYRRYAADMAETMKPWGDRALWLEVESVRGEIYSMTYQLRLHKTAEGGLKSHVMAAFDFNAKTVAYDRAKTEQFLSVRA